MAAFDSADLLARAIRLAARPASDQSMATADWYAFLTEAQVYWTNMFAVHCPHVLMSAPVLLTSADGGFTYTFPSSTYPLHIELYDSNSPGGRPLREGAYWDTSADFANEGVQIRIPMGDTQTWSGGPYLRYIAAPSTLDGSTAPTLQPPYARILLVYRAVALWASRGGFRDPTPFYALEQSVWLGNPAKGDVGLMGALKMQNPLWGSTAIQQSPAGILEGVDQGLGYSKVPLGGG